jgi:anti-anti-sigma factor
VSTTENSDITQFLTTSEENRKLTFTLRRELVKAEWSTIEQVGDSVLATVEEKKHPQVLMDLSELEHMGSSMVAMLVRLWKSVESKDGAMVFVCEENNIYEVLKLAGLTNVWTIKDNRQDALDLLGSTAERTGRNLGPFLVVVSLLTAALSGAMLAMILTGQHYVGAEEEPKIQIAAGIVSGFLGFWAFLTSHRVTKALGLIFGLIGLGLAVQALVT